ncbi:hypothetical protein KFL_002270180 [Klebsormidium nitens]|uniref:SLH domain-containing protein n=1 Tax=Klebsormidium nitens TaxID=105231 RepID=A0A1Y1I2Y6_KLENI|nr:hypothetical protein KFL_002270180 [Klebsormidium nitens]|eukprot:GAQ85284.1 hypothetical protein KFL_002270180 [Klebsormidium nitens]
MHLPAVGLTNAAKLNGLRGGGRCMHSKREKRLCVHASAGDSGLQESAPAAGKSATGSPNGGVDCTSAQEPVAKSGQTDTATNGVNGASTVEKVAQKSGVAHQGRLAKASDWFHEAAEEEAFTKWLPVVQEKERELPLVAVVGLTAGGLVLAIVLFLQGWSRVQHRVPGLPRLPFSVHKPHHGAKPEELGAAEKSRTEAEPQGTQGPTASLSSVHRETMADTARAEPVESAQSEKKDESGGFGKSVFKSVASLVPGFKHKKADKSTETPKEGAKGPVENAQSEKKDESSGIGKSVVEEVSALVPGLDKKGDGNAEEGKKGAEMEEVGGGKEKKGLEMEDVARQQGNTGEKDGGEGESKPVDHSGDAHLESSAVSEAETKKTLQDSARQSLIEKPDILISPIGATDTIEAERPSEKPAVQPAHEEAAQPTVQSVHDDAAQQRQVEKPEGAATRLRENEPAPVVLEPAVNVVVLRGGDGRRAPPSSPALMGGGSPTAVEENKGAVPAGILRAAADMLRSKELVDLDRGEDATPGESVSEKGEGVSAEREGVSEEKAASKLETGETREGGEKNQLLPEGGNDGQASEARDSPQEGIKSAGGKVPLPTNPLQGVSRPRAGGESFQDWYAKQKSGAGKSDVSASSKRPAGDLKPSAYVDKAQLQALQALQKLSVVEPDVQPTAVCSRRDFARWLLSGSSVLTGTPGVHPVPSEGVTDTAFDDVTFDDEDFAAIQGLAEAGIIPSRLSHGSAASSDGQFHPDAPLTRQDLVRWKMALDRRRLPTEADPKTAVLESWGFLDAELVHPATLPAMIADFQAGDQSVIARAFGYTLRFQPHKPVSVAQAAAALAAGSASETVSERVSEMESYRAADEVFREEAREQREIIEAVAARGEEIVKQLEADKGALAETRTTVDEAIKELNAHRDAIRAESAQLAQSVEQARSIILELSSGRSVSETERNALQAELQKLEDQRVAIEAVTSEAELHIGAEIRKARAAVEGLEGVREVLQSTNTNGRESESEQRPDSALTNGKPLVDLFDERMELADERARNPLKHAVRVASAHMDAAKGHVARLSRRVRSDGGDVMDSLREKTGHVAAAGSEFVRDVPEKVRQTVPSDVQDKVRTTVERVWARVERLLLLAWETLLRVWYFVLGYLRVGTERVKGVLASVQNGGRR